VQTSDHVGRQVHTEKFYNGPMYDIAMIRYRIVNGDEQRGSR